MERKLRLVTGLTLFGYAASHFIGHAIGIFGLDAMESIGRGVILAPWRTPPGRAALLASILIHGGLG
ncbi:MAG TPA: adenylate/guanylate cyclase domain-containing protein, partial [Roseiarcus sp.]|nr:adenylate/guanylate cyclase domain-containing protein [Roseiarcus sp.]